MSGVPDVPRVSDVLDHELIARPGPQDRLLLLVHGYGETADMMTSRLDRIDPEGRFVALVPTAPFEHKGKAIWHRALFGSSGEAGAQYLASIGRLDALVAEVCAREGFDVSAAVFGGFSQGAGLALGLSLLDAGRPPPAGCLAFCGFVPPVTGLRVGLSRVAGMPVLLLAATDDEFVPITASRQSASVLERLGLDLTYRELASTHTVNDAAADLAGAWLAGAVGGVEPGGRAADDDRGMWELVNTHWQLSA